MIWNAHKYITKIYTTLELKKLCNHIKMCLDAVTRLQQYLLTAYQSIKRHYDFQEYFAIDFFYPSYSWNSQTYSCLESFILVVLTNDTCSKSSTEPQVYKVVNTHDYEISGWKFLYRILHARDPHLGGMYGDFQSDLATLEFKQGEQLEYFRSIIIRLQK